jgi:hypothetical protein
MAANLDNVMTWAQACEQFASEILPHMQTIYEQDGKFLIGPLVARLGTTGPILSVRTVKSAIGSTRTGRNHPFASKEVDNGR